MTRLTADLALLLCAAVWGVAFLFQKSAMESLGPLTFIAARGSVAALVLLPLAILELRREPAPAAGSFWLVAGLAGLAFFVAAWLQQAGIVTATVTNTGFLTALYVVITPFIAWALQRKRPAAIVWPAALCSSLGTWLLGGGTLSAFSHGDILVALSAIFWAAHAVVVATGTVHRRAITFTAAQFAVVGACGWGAALCLEQPTLPGLATAAPSILYVGVLSSALTFTLLTYALRFTATPEAMVIVSLETVFAALAAYLVLGERLTGLGWMGAGLILAATLLLQLGAMRPADTHPRP